VNETNALAIVKAAQSDGALVFTNIENMEAKTELYRTEVTKLSMCESDFHTISGKYMPNKAATDRIGEACGVQFIQAACRVIAETRDDPICGKRTVYCAEAQGKVRMPDGSWRASTVDEYEFDPVLRAMMDKNVTELNAETRRIIGRAIMEYTKVGRQRAATGARLRVIRQLTSMPAAFEKADVAKPFVFTRVVQNTSYILQTPEGRAMATAQALGVDVASLFGGRKALAGEAAAAPAGNDGRNDDDAPPPSVMTTAAAEPDFGDEPYGTEPPAKPPKETEFDRLTQALTEFIEGFKTELDVTSANGKNPYRLAEEELADMAATEDSRRAMIEKLRTYLTKKGVSV
jgi:hypothetical protein